MAWRRSFARSFLSTARVSTFRSSRPLSTPSGLRPPPFPAARPTTRRFSVFNSRTLGKLGCAQSLMPLASGTQLTSHLSVSVRACCELSNGTFQRSCQDR